MKYLAILVLLLVPVMVGAHEWNVKPLSSEAYYERKVLIQHSVELGKRLGSTASTAQVTRITGLIYDTWEKHKASLPYIQHPRYAVALVWTESEMQSTVSNAGCLGIFQADLATTREVCAEYGIHYDPKTLANDLLKDEAFNTLIGLCELNMQLKAWKGNKDLAIVSYKCGPNKLRRWLEAGKLPLRVCHFYARVFKFNEFLSGKPFKNAPVFIGYGPNTLVRMFPNQYELDTSPTR